MIIIHHKFNKPKNVDEEGIVIDNNPVEEKIRFPFKDGRPLIKTAFFNLVQDVNALSPIL